MYRQRPFQQIQGHRQVEISFSSKQLICGPTWSCWNSPEGGNGRFATRSGLIQSRWDLGNRPTTIFFLETIGLSSI
jgi:hypothetical protein